MNTYLSENLNPLSDFDKKDLNNPPGVLSDIARYILDCSPLVEPGSAINAALALIGTALARSVCSETGLRTNIYLLSLYDNPGAADQIQAAIVRVVKEMDMETRLVNEIPTSGETLLRHVAKTPLALFQFDRLDHLIATALNDGAARHKLELFLNLIKLFSSTDTVLHGTEFADQERNPRVDIPYPCCSLHATALAEDFYETVGQLKSDYIRFISRFIVVHNDSDNSVQSMASEKSVMMPYTIKEWLESISQILPNGSICDIDPASPKLIKKSEGAFRIFRTFLEEVDSRRDSGQNRNLGDLWSRGLELADKVALICACADHPDNPVVDESQAEWAIQFVLHHTQQLVNKLQGKLT